MDYSSRLDAGLNILPRFICSSSTMPYRLFQKLEKYCIFSVLSLNFQIFKSCGAGIWNNRHDVMGLIHMHRGSMFVNTIQRCGATLHRQLFVEAARCSGVCRTAKLPFSRTYCSQVIAATDLKVGHILMLNRKELIRFKFWFLLPYLFWVAFIRTR